jgi:ketosteroid isomerase-like protein
MAPDHSKVEPSFALRPKPSSLACMKLRSAPALAVVLALLAGGPALAASDAEAAMATVRQFGEAINKADFKTAIELQAPDVEIIDEVPPHHWQGQGAAMAWLKSWNDFATANGVSGQSMVYGDQARVEVEGDHAYVTRPGVFSFKRGSAQVSETGMLGAALVRTPAGWRISAWTWAGATPK